LSIKISNDKKKWFLETKNTAYVIGVDEDKNLRHLYWGEKLPPVKLKGLISDSLYQFQDGNKKVILRGKALKEIGVKVDLKGDFDSKLIILEKENKRND
jgi:hypothetical protein